MTRPPAVSEDLFLRLKALFESLIVKGLDFRAEFDKFDDSFSGYRVALRGVLRITVVAHSCVCVSVVLMLSAVIYLCRVRHTVRLQRCPAGEV